MLDQNDKLINTGYQIALTKTEICNYEINDVVKASDIGLYIHPMFGEGSYHQPTFLEDPRVYEPHRRDKKYTLIPDGKGCVARCTFCHRWDSGIRYIPVEKFMARLDELIAKHDVGFISPATENFANDKRWLKEFCREIKKRDILWTAGAIRTKSVDPELIAMMKDAGCVSMSYGMETGSPSILEIMEKKTSLDDNKNAQKWTVEAGMTTVVQLVLGMPGESPKTIRETIDFVKYCFTLTPDLNPNNLSVNYAQALPGTPLYEYGRSNGLIGQNLEEEEQYLLDISDRNAHDEFTTLNFTDYPTLECQTWRPRITVEVNHAYVMKFGLDKYHELLLRDSNYFQPVEEDDGYHANPKRLLKTNKIEDANPTSDAMSEFSSGQSEIPGLWSLIRQRKLGLAMICHPISIYRFRWLLPVLVLYKNIQRFPPAYNIRLVLEYMSYKLFNVFMRRKWRFDFRSLRKIMIQDVGELSAVTPEMAPLRKGR